MREVSCNHYEQSLMILAAQTWRRPVGGSPEQSSQLALSLVFRPQAYSLAVAGLFR